MNKIRVIDLLNKIANGEISNKVKYKNRIYVWDEEYENYHVEYENWWLHPEYKKLNDEIEIIEEQQDIDIQEIEEIEEQFSLKYINSGLKKETEIELDGVVNRVYGKIDELIQAVKQLDRKIKEKE